MIDAKATILAIMYHFVQASPHLELYCSIKGGEIGGGGRGGGLEPPHFGNRGG